MTSLRAAAAQALTKTRQELTLETKIKDKNESGVIITHHKSGYCAQWHALSLLLPDLHGLFIIRFEELKVPVGLDGLPAVLAHVEHYDRRVAKGIDAEIFIFFANK